MEWKEVMVGTKVELLQHQYTLNVPFGRSNDDLFTHAELQDLVVLVFRKGDIVTVTKVDDQIALEHDDGLSIIIYDAQVVDQALYKIL